jgi:hypothetical protein
VRLAALAAGRRAPDWPRRLLDLARDLTMAEAGALLAEQDGAVRAIAPEAGAALPDAWVEGYRAAWVAGGVAARELGAGRWLMSVPVDEDTVLALVVPAAQPVDRALTRERLSLLAALAQSAAGAARLADCVPAAAAADSLRALLSAPTRPAGLSHAADALVRLLPVGSELALGLAVRGQVRALGVSGQPGLVAGGAFGRAVATAMSEALAAGEVQALPDPARASAALRAFPDAFGGRAAVAVPAIGRGAAAVLLAPPGEAAPAGPAVAALLRPALDLLAGAARPPARAARQRRAGGRIVLAASIAALVGLAAVLPRPDEVVGGFVALPELAWTVTAPFDGVLEATDTRPGDSVAAGQVLARMATRELALEVAAARARAASDRREAAIARAGGQPAQEQLAELSTRRAEAQVALLEYRLGLAEVRAPGGGVVLSGDLRRSLGQPLSRGQALFEIAPQSGLRAELLLPEARAHLVHPGQRALLSPASDPGARLAVRIERVRPMAEIVQNRNVFRAIASIEDPAGTGAVLRPGAEGLTRVEVGTTNWLAWALAEPLLAIRRWLWL